MIQTAISIFEEKRVRKIWYNEQWYFSVLDVIYALTDSKDSKDYLKKMRKRDSELDFYMGTNCPPLSMQWKNWKTRDTISANTEATFRIIQSIPSLKAEPFKLWLAKVGYERVQEIQNPELAQERMKMIYEQKWYPKERIERRLRWIAIRQELTDERKLRGVQSTTDYAILTNEITKVTFGMTVGEYMEHKWLDRKNNHNLRDNMTDFEVVLTMLGETTTTNLHRKRDSKQFHELQKDSHDGGKVAGNTRKDIEKQLWESVVSDKNYLHLTDKKKLRK